MVEGSGRKTSSAVRRTQDPREGDQEEDGIRRVGPSQERVYVRLNNVHPNAWRGVSWITWNSIYLE